MVNYFAIVAFLSIATVIKAENNKDNIKQYQSSIFTPTYDLIGWNANSPILVPNTGTLLNTFSTPAFAGQIPFSLHQNYQGISSNVLQDALQRQVLQSVPLYSTLNQLQGYPFSSIGGGLSNSQSTQQNHGATTYNGGYPIGYYRQSQLPLTGVSGGFVGGIPQPGFGTTGQGQGALGNVIPGSIVGSQFPGSLSGFPPGLLGGYGQGLPGAYIPGSLGGLNQGSLGGYNQGLLGGVTPGSLGGFVPGNFGNHVPGSVINSHAPGSLVGGFTQGPFTGGYAPGLLQGGYPPGSTIGGFAPGSLGGGYAPGSLGGGYAPGSLVGGYAPGSFVGGYAPGSFVGGYSPGQGATGGSYAPGSVIGGYSPGSHAQPPIVGNYGQGFIGSHPPGTIGSAGGHAPGSLVNPGSQGILGPTSLGATVSNSLVPGNEKANIFDYAPYGNDFLFAGYNKPILNSGELQKRIQDLLLNREATHTKPVKKDKE